MQRIAARTGDTAIAGACGVLEIGATGSLHQVAADRRGIAQLGGCARQQRFGDGRKGFCETRIISKVGIADHRPDAHAAIGKPFDAVETRQPADIDQPFRP